VANDEAVNELGEPALFGDVVEVRKPPLVIVTHVHPAIEHDVLAPNGHQDTAPPNICESPRAKIVKKNPLRIQSIFRVID